MKKISIEGKTRTRRLPDNFVSLLGFPEPENFHFLGLRPKSESENFQNLKVIVIDLKVKIFRFRET